MGNSPQFENIKNKALQVRNSQLKEQIKVVSQSIANLELNPQEINRICSLNVLEAITELNNAKITSEALVAAMCYRCSTTGAQLNVFTVTNFFEAIQTAKQCDKKRQDLKKKNWIPNNQDYNSQKFFPSLFGIPISLKDVFDVEGLTTTLGLIMKAMNKQKQSALVTCLKNAGAIPFVKSNIPQFGMNMQTFNTLWGRTLSPWNKARSVGGSSGGEGAMIAARCSILGVGSDIAGSIRIPAEHCGVFGLKPYSKRISAHYHAVFSKAFTCFGKSIPLCIGPLGKSALDLALFMNTLTTQEYFQGKEDPYCKIIPFDWKAYMEAQSGTRKYRIGYIRSLKDIEPSHASRRAISQTIDILKNDGHELIQIQIPRQRQVIKQFFAEYGSCKGENFRQILQGEKQVADYKTAFKICEMWSVTRFIVSVFTKKFQPRLHSYFFQRKPLDSVMQYQTHIGQLQALKQEWIKYWRNMKLDFLIFPGFGCQAFQHGKSDKLGLAGAYTFIWNVFDMAAGSMPITLVRENQLVYQSAVNDMLTTELKEVASGSKDLPVGIQVIGLPYQQQKVLGLMSYIDKKNSFYKKHPLPQI